MKATGIVRKIDQLGRIVLPMEIRKIFEFNEHQELEIYVENGYIIIRKHSDKCFLCDGDKKLMTYDSKLICFDCISQMYKIIRCNKGNYAG